MTMQSRAIASTAADSSGFEQLHKLGRIEASPETLAGGQVCDYPLVYIQFELVAFGEDLADAGTSEDREADRDHRPVIEPRKGIGDDTANLQVLHENARAVPL